MLHDGLRIFPKDVLHFRGPYTISSIQHLYLLNYSDRPIAFKVKTTAPRRFHVKPVSGVVPPEGGDVTVTLDLQPLYGEDGSITDGGPFDKMKQKFLVEWAYVHLEELHGETICAASVIQKARTTGDLNEIRFKCKFDADPVIHPHQPQRIHASDSLHPMPVVSTAASNKRPALVTRSGVSDAYQAKWGPDHHEEDHGADTRARSTATAAAASNHSPPNEVPKQGSESSLQLNAGGQPSSELEDDEHPLWAMLNHPLVFMLILAILLGVFFAMPWQHMVI